MKRFFATTVLALVASASPAQEIQRPSDSGIMQFSERSGKSMYSVEDIFPIGWSERGSFAYVTRIQVAGRGGTLFSYFVVSAVTDDILWKLDDDWPATNSVSIDQSMARNRAALLQMLDRHSIRQGRGTRLREFPLVAEGVQYRPKIAVKKKKEGDPFLRRDIEQVSLHILRSDGTQKTILTKSDPGAFSYWTAGYFRSPYEPRILVAIGEQVPGFEGTEGHFLFSGCSLRKGFE